MNKLVIQDDEGKTTVVPLIRDEITIGRKEGNTIRLTERNVSRRHARILRNNGAIAIEDLNSYNGVRVNGTRIQGRCQLSVADRVQIGDYLIELKSDEAEASADPYGEQRTQPIERIDPMANTPQPQAAQGQPTAVVDVGRIQGQAQPQSFDSAPTQPVAAPTPEATRPARMVILSTNFAGQDYELTKPAMVIGRTDDNDIVVNHRSISRHHAKVVQENGRYAIVDLQSSNGVRVNGEEYGKVELRRGDVVDLGHVRMRFVESGEDFLFGRDAHAVDISTGGGKGLIFALLAILVIGGGIGVFALTRGGGGGEEVSTSGAQSEPSQPATPAPSVAASDTDPKKAAATDTNATPAAADDAVAKMLGDARQAIEAEHWKEAKQIAEKALAQDPENAEAQDVIDQATRELDNQVIYNQFKKAVAAKSYAKIAKLFAQIDPTSVYKEQARDDHDAAHDAYKREVVAKAESDAAHGNCRKISQLAAAAGKVWPDVGDAVTAVGAHCSATVASSHRSSSRGSHKSHSSSNSSSSSSSSKSSNSSSSSASSGLSYNDLIDQARTAAKTGQWGKAIRQCEAALAVKHGDQEAAMVCALAACNIKNASKAKKYMGQLRSPSRKGMARQICLKNGVDIPIN